MSYFGAHNHTDKGSNQRLRDSTNKVNDLIEYAYNIGLKGIALTEHESITSHLSALKFYNSNKEKWGDFKLGLGNEIYLCNRPDEGENPSTDELNHFILIALDDLGHKCIRELSTIAWVNNAFMNVMYRVPTYYDDLEIKLNEYKGHIIASNACLGGALPKNLMKYKSSGDKEIWRACISWIAYMNEIFGKGHFFLELQPGQTEEQIYVNNCLLKLSEQTNTPYIITTDAHYLRKEDRAIHKTYLQSKEGDREVDSFYATTYVMTPDEIHVYMDDYIGYDAVEVGLRNTLRIYDMIEGYHLEKDLYIPYLPRNLEEPSEELRNKYKDKIPLLDDFFYSKHDSDRHMTRKMLEAIDNDKTYQTEEGYFKINECLDYVKRSSEKNKVQWSRYLMQVADYIDLCWQAGSIVAPGRGSGGGFCLLHLLGIIQINQLRETTKMYPMRFLNPDRVSVLDIDTDVCPSKRDKIIQLMKDTYGQDRVCKVLTLSTEKSKQAILTSGRGLGIDNDTTSYIASLVVFDRGQPRTLHQMYYGDDDFQPVIEFKNEMDKYPELWEASQKIEGLVSGIGSHAGGVIIVDEPFTNSTALMRTKSGDVVTQFDLHECEDVSLIKIDLLATDAIEKIGETLQLLLKDNVIEWQGSLRNTYEKYIGVYTLERNAEDMWRLLWEHKVLSFFQMEKASGVRAITLAKPHSVDDLATLNSVIRLMAQEKGAESPLDKFARFHDDITQWYEEMDEAGLSIDEQTLIKKYLATSYGICEAQEYLMIMSMDPAIGGFDLMWADRLRKAVGKKKAKDFNQLEKEFFENRDEKQLSVPLTDYVWKVLFSTQRGLRSSSR